MSLYYIVSRISQAVFTNFTTQRRTTTHHSRRNISRVIQVWLYLVAYPRVALLSPALPLKPAICIRRIDAGSSRGQMCFSIILQKFSWCGRFHTYRKEKYSKPIESHDRETFGPKFLPCFLESRPSCYSSRSYLISIEVGRYMSSSNHIRVEVHVEAS